MGTTPAPNRSVWIALASGALVLLILILAIKTTAERRRGLRDYGQSRSVGADHELSAPSNSTPGKRYSAPTSQGTPEQIVAGMVTQFGRSRREIARAMGRRNAKEMPAEVERFFDAIEAGNWDEIEKLWKVLSKKSGQYDGGEHSPEIDPFWSSILDAYGVAEQAHMWPAQKLLDYGHSILDSLRPGMVYVGGTDPGRWIPEMLNESTEQPRIIVTQNAFADSRYLEFMNQVYGDRMKTLTEDDSKKIFDEYVVDAQKRYEHDQNFPNEPKQVKPGENIAMVDGKTQVSGQIAVMTINEKLFQKMMEKNPDMSFAIEQSFPFKSTYANAAIMGPIMEVSAAEGENALNSERALSAVDYWRKTTAEITGADGLQDEKLRKAYSKLAANQAELLSNRNFIREAEETYRLAAEMVPSSPEAVYGYANLLASHGRLYEALPIVEKAIAADPKNQNFKELLENVRGKK
jgi:tetratricopeptide (TPR) repeat protein